MMESRGPFDEPTKFSKITNDTLLIPRVISGLLIEVDEEGIKEAREKCGDEAKECIKFICDRPFIFLIHDQGYETIFFIGKYANPSMPEKVWLE